LKPSLQFSVPCLEVTPGEDSTDQEPPSLKYLFYELPFPSFPYQASFYIVNGWCRGRGRHYQVVKILGPDRKAIVETPQQDFELPDETTPFMAINRFEGIPFERPGTYWVQVFLGEQQSLEYPLTVRQAERP
jgi:hypothetical protein